MDPTAILPPLSAQAFFWSVSPSEPEVGDHFKIKYCDVHPELPLVLAVDKFSNIQLWDIFQCKLLFSRSISDIFHSLERRVPASTPGAPAVRDKRSSTIGFKTSALQHEELLKKIKEAGSVRSVKFVDRYALCWTTGQAPMDSTSDCYNNDSRILIVCDAGVLFYDYSTGIAHHLSQTELSRNPTAVEFVAPDVCAIGCSDGQIRMWDCNSWSSSAKPLSGHVKGDIVSLKMLCGKSYRGRATSAVPPAEGTWGGSSMDSSASGLASSPIEKEEKPMLFSIGYDGGSYLWDLSVSGAAVSVLGGSPSGYLQSHGHMTQHFDGITDTLYTVGEDRSIRLWDIGNISKSGQGAPATRRRSFLGSSAGPTDAGKISCVGKAKPRNDLSGPISKYTHCTAIEHPRFPVGTFAVCAKSNAIGIVQIYQKTSDDEAQSERSSLTAGDTSASMKFHELHLFQLSSVLLSWLLRLRDGDLDAAISSSLIDACKDSNHIKVYCLHSHPMYPHVLVAGTSLGVVALSLHNPVSECDAGARVGTHLNWGNKVITYSERTVRLSAIRLAKQTPNAVPKRSRRQVSRGSRTFDSATITAVLSSTEEGIVFENLGELSPSVAHVGPGDHNVPIGLDSSSRGRTNSTLMLTLSHESSLATFTSRPIFYPSCSGMFCAAVWPESRVYVIFNVDCSVEPPESLDNSMTSKSESVTTPSRPKSVPRGSVNQDSSKNRAFIEVDRGMCYSLGWCTAATSAESSDEESHSNVNCDILCLITPARRISAPKKRGSIIGDIFSSKKKETDAILPSSLIIKQIWPDLKVKEVVPGGVPENVTSVIGGGAYLCITTPISTSSNDNGKRAVSQIELEAQAEARNRAASTVSNLDKGVAAEDVRYSTLAPISGAQKSQFYRLAFGVMEIPKANAEHNKGKMSSKADNTATEMPGSPAPALKKQFYFAPVGPIFQQVQSVAWDHSRGYLALTMKMSNRISIMSFNFQSQGSSSTSSGNGADLGVVGSVQLCDGGLADPLVSRTQHLLWYYGTLFAVTPKSIYAVFTNGAADGKGSNHASPLKPYLAASLHKSVSDPSRLKGHYGSGLPSRPFGLLQCVSVLSGNLVVVTQSGVLSIIPLNTSPIVAVGLLVNSFGAREADQLNPWIQLVPPAVRGPFLSLLRGVRDEDDNRCFGQRSVKSVLSYVEDCINRGVFDSEISLDSYILASENSGCALNSFRASNSVTFLEAVLIMLSKHLTHSEIQSKEAPSIDQSKRVIQNVLQTHARSEGAATDPTAMSMLCVAAGTKSAPDKDCMAAIVKNDEVLSLLQDRVLYKGMLTDFRQLSDTLMHSDLGIHRFQLS